MLPTSDSLHTSLHIHARNVSKFSPPEAQNTTGLEKIPMIRDYVLITATEFMLKLQSIYLDFLSILGKISQY